MRVSPSPDVQAAREREARAPAEEARALREAMRGARLDETRAGGGGGGGGGRGGGGGGGGGLRAVAEEREWAERTAEATFDTGED